MRKRTFEIFGRTFEYKGMTYGKSYCDRDLDDCYARPSDTKRAIWNDWTLWFVNCCRSVTFGISSYNAQFFSIQGFIKLDGHYWFLEITPKHNRAWLIDED